VTRFAGAAAIGALVVAAGFIGTDPSHPAVKKFHGISELGDGIAAKATPTHHAAYRRAAPTPARHHHLGSLDNADPVGRLGDEDDIAQIDSLDAQVERLTRELAESQSESTELEKQVQALEQSIVDTREEFLKIGHGGKNKHLAGSHENEIIADLENQLKDKHYELEKTRQQKYKLYVRNNECNSAQAELDKKIAEYKKDMIEAFERAEEVKKFETCAAEKEAVASKLVTCAEKLEMSQTDLAAARGDDVSDDERISSLESKLSQCHDSRDASADTIADFKKAVESDQLELAARQRLVDELNAKAAASDELANRLKAEVSMLVEDVQACELDGKSFDFFCAGEGETCECPDGDIVWGPRYHASDPEKANTFADVIATQNFIVHPGKSGFECTNEHVGGDPESGQPKACFCAPKGLNYDVKASVDVEQPSPAPAVAEQPAPPAPEVVEEPAVDAADVESYEDALESAPAPAQPEVEPVDVSEELSKQFEENVGDDTIREVETDAEIREDDPAATPAPHSHTNASDSDSGVHLEGEEWKKYDEEDLDDLYEDLNESLSEDEELPEGVDDTATRVAAENAAAAKAEAEAKAAAVSRSASARPCAPPNTSAATSTSFRAPTSVCPASRPVPWSGAESPRISATPSAPTSSATAPSTASPTTIATSRAAAMSPPTRMPSATSSSPRHTSAPRNGAPTTTRARRAASTASPITKLSRLRRLPRLRLRLRPEAAASARPSAPPSTSAATTTSIPRDLAPTTTRCKKGCINGVTDIDDFKAKKDCRGQGCGRCQGCG